MLVTRSHQGATEKVALKSGIDDGHHESRRGQSEKNGAGSHRVGQCFVKYCGESVAIKFDDARALRAPSHVDAVMRTAEQLIQGLSLALTGRIFANRRQIRTALAI